MKPSAPADTQPKNYRPAILDDEERNAVVQPFINCLNAQATEDFASFLINLINESHRPLGTERIEQELLATLERTFQHSKAYELALELYSSRFAFVPGTVSVTGLNLEDMLIDIKRSRVTERQEAMPEEWALEFGSTVGRLLNNNKLSELSYISLRDPLVDLTSEGDHSLGNLSLALLPFVLTKYFAKMTAPKIILLITAADARNPKEPIEMGRLTKGRVWEDFEKLVIDLDQLLPSKDEELYHPLTIALEREDGARYIVYHREVANSLVEKLFDYVEQHLEVDSTIRPAIGLQTSDAPDRKSDAQPAAFNAGAADRQPATSPAPEQEDTRREPMLSRPQALSDWIESFSQIIAQAIEGEMLPEEARNDLSDMAIKITGDFASKIADHARYLLPVALKRFNGQFSEVGELAGQIRPEPIVEIGKSLLHLAKKQPSSNWIDELDPMIAEALESGQLPNETQTALEDWVTNITDEHASGYADQARHLLALGLRRLVANPPDDAEDDDAEDSDDADAEDKAPEQSMLLNLCDYTDLKLDFLLSEGGDRVFSFSLHRDDSIRDHGKGNADVCFNTYGERNSSYLYEGIFLPKHEGAIEHSVSIVISGEGKVQFCGHKEVLLFTLYWEKDGDSLDGGFDIFDTTGLAQSLEFSMEA